MYYIHDGDKSIALTIDDGPSPVYTPQILRLLAKYKITASFSMIGRSVDEYPEIAREVARAGHPIVNHTWDHSNLAPMTEVGIADEINRAAEAIHRATGDTPRIFRAPYGAWSRTLLEFCGRNGLTALDWSIDPRDWARPGTDAIVDNILDNTQTGSIILEHDGGGDRSETVAALRIVIPRLLDEGYHFRAP
jgi:peptidoglycan-N-acetylglucosamine deacetylase